MMSSRWTKWLPMPKQQLFARGSSKKKVGIGSYIKFNKRKKINWWKLKGWKRSNNLRRLNSRSVKKLWEEKKLLLSRSKQEKSKDWEEDKSNKDKDKFLFKRWRNYKNKSNVRISVRDKSRIKSMKKLVSIIEMQFL